MSDNNLPLALLLVFAPLSLVTIGGGQSAVADIHRQIVDVHQWMSESQFLDAFAISRMAPGPGSVLAPLIGWQLSGFWGAVAATIGIFGPTALLTLGIASLWRRYEGAHLLHALELGLRPVAAGMILAAVYVLLQALDGGWLALVIALASTALLLMSNINALILLGAGAAIFFALHETGLL